MESWRMVAWVPASCLSIRTCNVRGLRHGGWKSWRSGRRLAADEATRLGNEAVKIGGQLGNEALDRIATEVKYRPLVTLALAVSVGILIGMAGARRP